MKRKLLYKVNKNIQKSRIIRYITKLIQYIKKKQDKNEDNLSEKDGYDASNSDHSKNKSKTTRALRIQRKKNQNPNAEFDTDRERGNKKS